MPRPSARPSLSASVLAACLLVLAAPGAAGAQEIRVGVLLGSTGEGPGGGITSDFAAAGYSGVAGDCRVRCESRDMTETGAGVTGFPWLLEGRYGVTPWAGVALQVGGSPIGRTSGSRGESSLERREDYLYVSYATSLVAAVASVEALGVVRLGAGAARYGASVKREDAGRLAASSTTAVWGPLLEGGVSVPLGHGVRLEARGQYRMVGEVSYGPYAFSEADPTVIFPTAEADFTHWMAGAGLSLEIGR